MRPWRRRPRDPGLPPEEPISPEDLAWRIGATDERPIAARPNAAPPGSGQPGGRVAVEEVRVPAAPVTRRARPVVRGRTSRLVLWRDASAMLLGVVAVAVVAQLALSNRERETAAPPSGSAAGLPSEVALGATSSPGGLGLPTIGPVVDPGLITGIEATPTPLSPPTRAPVATARPIRRPVPAETPRPTPRPTAPGATTAPAASLAPTPSPTATPFIWYPPPPVPTPTPAPTQAPTPPPTTPPTPPPTPVPAPTVSISCAAPAGLTVTCTATAQNAVAGSEVWTVSGPGTLDSGGTGWPTITWTFDASGTYTIGVIVDGQFGGTASDSATVFP